MAASISSSVLAPPTDSIQRIALAHSPAVVGSSNLLRRRTRRGSRLMERLRRRRSPSDIPAINDVSGAAGHPALGDVSWQIVVGASAGVVPFLVAGIEFSKRIIAQRRCEQCGGSGLVLRENSYFRCPRCGGFLPWQSWKRFFSG